MQSNRCCHYYGEQQACGGLGSWGHFSSNSDDNNDKNIGLKEVSVSRSEHMTPNWRKMQVCKSQCCSTVHLPHVSSTASQYGKARGRNKQLTTACELMRHRRCWEISKDQKKAFSRDRCPLIVHPLCKIGKRRGTAQQCCQDLALRVKVIVRNGCGK